MASVVIKAQNASATLIWSEIIDSTTLPAARAKARRYLAHSDEDLIVQKFRVGNYEYWTVIRPAHEDAWRESYARSTWQDILKARAKAQPL